MYVVKFVHVTHLVYTMQKSATSTKAAARARKDSNSLETSRDDCVVVRDVKITVNQGTQFVPVTTKYSLDISRSF